MQEQQAVIVERDQQLVHSQQSVKDLTAQLGELRCSHSAELDTLRSQIEGAASAEVAALRSEVTELKQREVDLQKQLEQSRTAMLASQQQVVQLQADSQSEAQQLKEQIAQLKSELASITYVWTLQTQHVSQLKMRLASMELQLSDALSKRDKAYDEVQEAGRDLKRSDERVTELGALLQAAYRDKDDLQTRYDALSAVHSSQTQALRQVQQQVQSLSSRLDTAHSTASGLQQRLDQTNRDLTAVTQAQDSLQAELQDTKLQLHARTGRVQQLDALQQQHINEVEALRTECAGLKEQLKEERDRTRVEQLVLEQQLDDEREAELKSLTRRLETALRSLRHVSAQLETVETERDDAQRTANARARDVLSLRDDLQQAQSELARAQSAFTEATAELARVRTDRQTASADLARVRAELRDVTVSTKEQDARWRSDCEGLTRQVKDLTDRVTSVTAELRAAQQQCAESSAEVTHRTQLHAEITGRCDVAEATVVTLTRAVERLQSTVQLERDHNSTLSKSLQTLELQAAERAQLISELQAIQRPQSDTKVGCAR